MACEIGSRTFEEGLSTKVILDIYYLLVRICDVESIGGENRSASTAIAVPNSQLGSA